MMSKTVLLTMVIMSFVLAQSFAAPTDEANCLGVVGEALTACYMRLRAGFLGTNANANSNQHAVDEFFAGEPTQMKSFAVLNNFLRRHATEKVVSIIEFYEPKKPERRMFTQPRFFDVQAAKLKELGYEHFYAIELSIDDLEDQQIVKDMQLEFAGMKVTIGDRWCANVNRLGRYLKSIEDFLKYIPNANVSSAHECHFELRFEKLELEKTPKGVYQVHSFRELNKFTEYRDRSLFSVLEIHIKGKRSKGFLSSLSSVENDLGEDFAGAELEAATFHEKSSLDKCEVKESMVLVYDAEMSTWWRIPPAKGALHPTVEQVQRFATEFLDKNKICGDKCAKKWREEHKTAGKLDFELKFEGYD